MLPHIVVNTAKKTAFISEMEMIQAKVNIIYENRKTSEKEIQYYDGIGQDISKVDSAKLAEVLKGASRRGI